MVHLSLGSVRGGATPFPSLDFRDGTTSGRLIGGWTVPRSTGRERCRLHRVRCAGVGAGGAGKQRTGRRECPQGRCAQTQSAPDKDDGSEEVDQAQQAARSAPGPKAKGERQVEGRATEEVNNAAYFPGLQCLLPPPARVFSSWLTGPEDACLQRSEPSLCCGRRPPAQFSLWPASALDVVNIQSSHSAPAISGRHQAFKAVCMIAAPRKPIAAVHTRIDDIRRVWR
jgi:hypothetical protein